MLACLLCDIGVAVLISIPVIILYRGRRGRHGVCTFSPDILAGQRPPQGFQTEDLESLAPLTKASLMVMSYVCIYHKFSLT